ncbi:MAG: hypothetical protein A2Z95_01270 [Gallionellales bacterium GWA2_60_18]|nr:MAG: hypothetical protein A2Z95_01270 [Gallionellales bacterium GWA2_60_18]
MALWKKFDNAALVAVLWLVAAGYAAFVAWAHYDGYAAAARGEMPLYTDYTPTYAASLLLREIPAQYLYVQGAMVEAGRLAAHAMYGGITDEQAHGVGFAPFMYPPTFILLIAPLAYLPYLLSWFLWLGVTAVPYLAAMRRILPGLLAWPFALAAPPVFYNVMYGQTGFLSAGLIALGLVMLRRNPLWAGVFIGLASVKPHLGVLIPFALLAGAHWRAFASAALTVIATIIVSLLAFGDDPWFAFIGTGQFHLQGFAHGAYNYAPMTTVLATLRLAGVAHAPAMLAQYLSAALMVALVGAVWWRGRKRPDLFGLQAAILCLATPLAVPMMYLYDLVLLVPAAAWLWQDMRERGAGHWEYVVLGGAMAALLAVKPLAEAYGIQPGAALIVILLMLALRRYWLAWHAPAALSSVRG